MPRNQGTSRKGKPGKHDRASGMGRALAKQHHQVHRRGGGGRGAGGAGPPGGLHLNDTNQPTNSATTGSSILERSDLDDFIHQAAASQQEFASERMVILDPVARRVDLNAPTVRWADQEEPEQQQFSIPRRPPWTPDMTPEEIDAQEQAAFVEWRRGIARAEAKFMAAANDPNNDNAFTTTTVTPFEKNLQVWRQLWRVLERSDVIVQLVDARNIQFYSSLDLKAYASSLGKPMMLLVNKADYLSRRQRRAWKRYLEGRRQEWLSVVFFSAAREQEILDNSKNEDDGGDDDDSNEANNYRDDDDDDGLLSRRELLSAMLAFAEKHRNNNDDDIDIDIDNNNKTTDDVANDAEAGDANHNKKTAFGMVGFPNVGKSSVINVLMGARKNDHKTARVGVARQPGKTKHFQTLHVPDAPLPSGGGAMILCDCPGLVFPSVVHSTADLILAGVYPLSQMRGPHHWNPAIELVLRRVPYPLICILYGIPQDHHHDNNSVTAPELLSRICHARGWYASASGGNPDYGKAARNVLTQYTTGTLLYCHAPPQTTTTPPRPLPSEQKQQQQRQQLPPYDGDDDAGLQQSSWWKEDTIQAAVRITKKYQRVLAESTVAGRAAGPRQEGEAAEQQRGGVIPTVGAGGDQRAEGEEDDSSPLMDALLAPGNTKPQRNGTQHQALLQQQQKHKPDKGSRNHKYHNKGNKKRDRKKNFRNNPDPYGCHSAVAPTTTTTTTATSGKSQAVDGMDDADLLFLLDDNHDVTTALAANSSAASAAANAAATTVATS